MLLKLQASVLGQTAPRILHCPFCAGIAYSHGINRHRQIVDMRLNEIEQRRFRCTRCGRTFQGYPEGVERCAQRSKRLKGFGVILYALGLSYRDASSAVRHLAGRTCPSTVYNDVQDAGEAIESQHKRKTGRVAVLGMDGTGQQLKGGNQGVIFAVDNERQLLVRVELMDEKDEAQVLEFVQELCKSYDVKVLLTDEHNSYETMDDDVAIDHQLCEAHWKRSKRRRIGALSERARKRGWKRAAQDLEDVEMMVKRWPEIDEGALWNIVKTYLQYKPPPKGMRWSFGYEIRLAMQDVLENWKRVGPTNNTTERLIGLLLKMRSKVMRGFQKKENIKKFVYLCAHLWEHRDSCDPSTLFN